MKQIFEISSPRNLSASFLEKVIEDSFEWNDIKLEWISVTELTEKKEAEK